MNRQNRLKKKQNELFNIWKVMRSSIKERWIYAMIGAAVFFGALFVFGGCKEETLVISAIASVLSVFVIIFTGKVLYRDAFIIIVCFGMLFSLTTPILDTPDETAHLARAMYLAQGKLFVSQKDSELLISKDYDLLYEQSQKTVLENNLNVHDSDVQMVESDGLKATNAYAFVSYLPQALGIGFGRLVNFSVLWSFYLGRMTNLLFYAIMIALAIKITPIFKQFFLIAGTIPMAVYIAASYNQDAFGIGVIFVTIAYFLYLLNKEEQTIRISEILGYIGLCMLVVLTKFPFVLLVLLLVFIPAGKFDRLSTHLLVIPGILMTAAFSLIWMKFYSTIPHPFVPDGVGLVEQIKFLIGDPIVNSQMLARNLMEGIVNILMLFNFGWLSYNSNGLALLYLFFLGAVTVFYPKEFIQKPMTQFGAILVILGIYTGINLSMYLTWTPVGANVINGVQGRYFIGFLPLIPLALNIGPLFKQLKKQQTKVYQSITTFVPICFLLMALALTLSQYY